MAQRAPILTKPEDDAGHVLGSVAGPIGAATGQRSANTKATADILLTMIETLGLQAGDRLPVERELATQLNVSRSTVREAIRALTSMGVLSARQGSGTYVTELSAERLATPLLYAVERNATSASALMDVRGMLEVGATELAATRATKADIKRLHRLADAIRTDQDGVRNLAADRKFHHAIHELADNELLIELIGSVWHLGASLRQRIMAGTDVIDRTLAAHEIIITGIASGDPILAGTAMRAHIEDIRGWLEEAIESPTALANGQSNP